MLKTRQGEKRKDEREREREREVLPDKYHAGHTLGDSGGGHVLKAEGGQALAFKMKATLPSIQFPEHPGAIEALKGLCAS